VHVEPKIAGIHNGSWNVMGRRPDRRRRWSEDELRSLIRAELGWLLRRNFDDELEL